MSIAPKVSAGKLADWGVGDLPDPPMSGRKLWLALIGPGIVLAGTSVGTGEWLFGPSVSAQYGACLFWLATLSIFFQGFCNLMFMRYAIYCGEPMNVGILRTWPGPMAWIVFFAILDLPAILPYNASNAAVPLTAAILGRLPQSPGDDPLLKGLGITIFLLSFVPLVFGGTVYRMLEKIMATKLIVVLGYLSIIAFTMVSLPVVWDVATGFLRFGTVPLRPDVLIVDRHFNVREVKGQTEYAVKGSWELKKEMVTGELTVTRDGQKKTFNLAKTDGLDAEALEFRNAILSRSKKYLGHAYAPTATQQQSDSTPVADVSSSSADLEEKFLIEVAAGTDRLVAEGMVHKHHVFDATWLEIHSPNGRQDYSSLDTVPEPHRSQLANHLKHEGMAYVNVVGYVQEHGRLPNLDWAVIVGFIAIAGAGGLTNTMFSNYARDKGWGMGCHVGAIPSAFGGVKIGLSHTGKVFPLSEENRSRWHGWMRHIRRDQAIWIVASVIGMALPCMMSLEFIRNAAVFQDRVTAMSAEGIATRFPAYAQMFWFLTLFCGFLVLAPGQISVGDQVARRWTDMIWNASPRAKKFGEVRKLYYSILAAFCVLSFIILVAFPPVKIAIVSAVLQNIALGSTALMSLYVNRSLLPKELHPGWFHQIGVVLCGIFFLSISVALLFI